MLTPSLTGCAGSLPRPLPSAGLTIPLDPSLRKACPTAEVPARRTNPATGQATLQVAQVEAFALAEAADNLACDGRRASLVALIDAHNALVDQTSGQIGDLSRPWWMFWSIRRPRPAPATTPH